MLRQRVKARGVPRHELAVPGPVGKDHLHHGQRQRRIGAGAQQHHLIGQGACLGPAHVDDHDPRAAPFGLFHMADRMGLTDRIGPPEDDHRGMRAHILLGRGFQRPGQTQTKTAQPPADHRRVPRLAAVEIGKAFDQAAFHAHAVVVHRIAMPLPDADRLGSHAGHMRRDQVQRLGPASRLPRTLSGGIPAQRRQQPLVIADDLMRGLAPHAQKTPAVRVVGVAGNRDKAIPVHRHRHAAQRGVAVHRAHRLDDMRLGHGSPRAAALPVSEHGSPRASIARPAARYWRGSCHAMARPASLRTIPA